MPKPIYTPESTTAVHNLHLGWTGWFKSGIDNAILVSSVGDCRELWHDDGLELVTYRHEEGSLKILCSTTPDIRPSIFAQRIKGRLVHALRSRGICDCFKRKLAVRSLGDNTRTTVERYVDLQVPRSDFVDSRFKQYLGDFTVSDLSIHLEEAFATARGRYWYNLHLVIVIDDRRFPVTRNENFVKLRDTCRAIAQKKGYGISRLSIMPDHIHAAVRGAVDQSPEEIALAFLNNLSYVMGYNHCWSDEYYVGTFSEYHLNKATKPRQA